jgi:hypothetical protein
MQTSAPGETEALRLRMETLQRELEALRRRLEEIEPAEESR